MKQEDRLMITLIDQKIKDKVKVIEKAKAIKEDKVHWKRKVISFLKLLWVYLTDQKIKKLKNNKVNQEGVI